MPNFKLSGAIRSEIRGRIVKKLNNAIAINASGFPLTTRIIQNAVMRDEDLKLLWRLENNGLHGLPRDRDITVWLSSSYMPDLARDCIIFLTLPEKIFIPKRTGWAGNIHTNGSTWDVCWENVAIRLDTGRLDDADRKALATWANRVVRARRSTALVMAVHDFIMRGCDTTGELLADWPLLAQCATSTTWRDKFRNPPRNLMPYKSAMTDKHMRWLDGASQVLLGADMLPEWEHTPGTILARIKGWKPLPGDTDFNETPP